MLWVCTSCVLQKPEIFRFSNTSTFPTSRCFSSVAVFFSPVCPCAHPCTYRQLAIKIPFYLSITVIFIITTFTFLLRPSSLGPLGSPAHQQRLQVEWSSGGGGSEQGRSSSFMKNRKRLHEHAVAGEVINLKCRDDIDFKAVGWCVTVDRSGAWCRLVNHQIIYYCGWCLALMWLWRLFTCREYRWRSHLSCMLRFCESTSRICLLYVKHTKHLTWCYQTFKNVWRQLAVFTSLL